MESKERTLRRLLCDVAFNKWRALEFLLRFLDEQGDRRAALIRGQAHPEYTLGALAYFGIHPCSGCGGDPVWLQETHGKSCLGCAGSCWMHEEKADPGVVETDPLFPGWGFTVRWRPGMFGSEEKGWTPKWRDVGYLKKTSVESLST